VVELPVVVELPGVVVVPIEPPVVGVPVVLVPIPESVVPMVPLEPTPPLEPWPPAALVPLGSVPIVPLVEPVVPDDPVVPFWVEVAVPCPPAEVPLEPAVWPSAATATTRTPLATNVANFSFIVIRCLPWCGTGSYGRRATV